jgi:uncharacterized protein YidB (DUF937 family)
MNNNPLLGQVLGGLFGQALGQRNAGGGGLGGMLGGVLGGGGGDGGGIGGAGLGSVLTGALRNRTQPTGEPGAAPSSLNPTALLVTLLPLAMRWVQRSGGINAVLERFRQKGLGGQAQSWLSTGPNQPIDPQSVEQVVGQDELQQMAQRLGVPQQQVAQAFAEIMPQLVDHLTPDGQVPQHADAVLAESARTLEQHIEQAQSGEVRS